MKKFFLFCLLLIPQMKIQAEETWSDWSQDKPIGKNIIIEEEERYKWYRNKEKVNYIRLDDEYNCEYLDKENYILSDWVISYDSPEYKEYRTIENVALEQKRDINLIKTLHIFNIISSDLVNITEIQLISNKTILEYEITDHMDFSIERFDKLDDGVKDEIAIDFENHDKISLTLNNFKKLENMKLEIYFINNNNLISQIGISSGHDLYKYLTFQNITNTNYAIDCDEIVCKLTIDLEKEIKNKTVESPINVYKYQDRLYKCTNIEQNYLDGYYNYIEGYEKDENSKLMFYRYKVVKNEKSLNKIDEIIYNQKETNDNNNEDINAEKSSNLITYARENNKKENKKPLTNKVLIFSLIFFLLTTISLIIKKIVNKYRTK